MTAAVLQRHRRDAGKRLRERRASAGDGRRAALGRRPRPHASPTASPTRQSLLERAGELDDGDVGNGRHRRFNGSELVPCRISRAADRSDDRRRPTHPLVIAACPSQQTAIAPLRWSTPSRSPVSRTSRARPAAQRSAATEEVVTTMLAALRPPARGIRPDAERRAQPDAPGTDHRGDLGRTVETLRAVEAPDHSSVVRVLELAREQTAADAASRHRRYEAGADPRNGRALAVRGGSGRRARCAGLPRRPRDPGVLSTETMSPRNAPGDANPIRSGLAIPLSRVAERAGDARGADEDTRIAGSARSTSRRSRTFSASARPGLETSLELREPDPVPERDPLDRSLRPPGVPCASRPRDRPRQRQTRASRAARPRRRPPHHDQRAHRATLPPTTFSRRSRVC